jgi:hypothetical protein
MTRFAMSEPRKTALEEGTVVRKWLSGFVFLVLMRLEKFGGVAYGGNKGRVIYHPTCRPADHHTADSYLNNNRTTIRRGTGCNALYSFPVTVLRKTP